MFSLLRSPAIMVYSWCSCPYIDKLSMLAHAMARLDHTHYDSLKHLPKSQLAVEHTIVPRARAVSNASLFTYLKLKLTALRDVSCPQAIGMQSLQKSTSCPKLLLHSRHTCIVSTKISMPRNTTLVRYLMFHTTSNTFQATPTVVHIRTMAAHVSSATHTFQSYAKCR